MKRVCVCVGACLRETEREISCLFSLPLSLCYFFLFNYFLVFSFTIFSSPFLSSPHFSSYLFSPPPTSHFLSFLFMSSLILSSSLFSSLSFSCLLFYPLPSSPIFSLYLGISSMFLIFIHLKYFISDKWPEFDHFLKIV